MKVLLLQDSKNIGKKGDIINVSDGFAFNNLIPRGIARSATASVLAEAKRNDDRKKKEIEEMQVQLRSDAEKINKKKITIHAQAKGDKLFGSVTQKDIAQALLEQHKVSVSEKAILLAAPIKELTTQEVRVDYGHNVSAGIIVTIVSK